MYTLRLVTAVVFLSGILYGHCRPAGRANEHPLLAYFEKTALPDTLVFQIPEDEDSIRADTIPNALFFKDIDADMLLEIDYLADSTASTVLGLERYALSDSVQACLVDIRLSWFRHQSILLYNSRQHRFTGRVTVAEFFGGDGGQLLTGSWMFDYDGDGLADLIRRDIGHNLRMVGEDDVQEFVDESALLLLNTGNGFRDAPLTDTAAAVRQYPIRSYW